MAQRFNESRGEVFGEQVNIAFNVGGGGSGGFRPHVSASPNGMLVFNPKSEIAGDVGKRFAWFDRQGRRLGELPPDALGSGPSLSPDDKRLALFRIDTERRTSDIWITDLEGSVTSRFTFLPHGAVSPVWSPDGRKIAFVDTQRKVYVKDSDGKGEPQLLPNSSASVLSGWSPDGRYLLAISGDKMSLLPANGPGEGGATLDATDIVHFGSFSPDGRYIAFLAHDTGGHVIYAMEAPPGKGRWQIFSKGEQPSWRRDGKELYFLRDDSTLMAVDVRPGHAMPFGAPKPLFGTGIKSAAVSAYAVSADGQRFLIPLAGEKQDVPSLLTVVVNWETTK